MPDDLRLLDSLNTVPLPAWDCLVIGHGPHFDPTEMASALETWVRRVNRNGAGQAARDAAAEPRVSFVTLHHGDTPRELTMVAMLMALRLAAFTGGPVVTVGRIDVLSDADMERLVGHPIRSRHDDGTEVTQVGWEILTADRYRAVYPRAADYLAEHL